MCWTSGFKGLSGSIWLFFLTGVIAMCRKNVQRLIAQAWAYWSGTLMERVHKRAACIRSRDQALLCFKIALRHLTSAVVAVFRNVLQRPSSPHSSGDGGKGKCHFLCFWSLVKWFLHQDCFRDVRLFPTKWNTNTRAMTSPGFRFCEILLILDIQN